jgi:membrane-associated phospholipid phosphatase
MPLNWEFSSKPKIGRQITPHTVPNRGKIPLFEELGYFSVVNMARRPRTESSQSVELTGIRKWAVVLSICALCITVSYYWIDRPVAYLVHNELRGYRGIFDVAARLPKLIGPLVIACTLVLAVRAVTRRPLTEIQTAIVLSALSLAFSDVLENWLKFAFGRTWPETWVQDNPSLIRDGVHNFNPFHGGPGFASFPSGHMVAICAIMSVFWVMWARFRPIYAICIGTVFIGQLGANYHFVSDLVAGGFLGISVGWAIIALWNAGTRPIGIESAVPPEKRHEE